MIDRTIENSFIFRDTDKKRLTSIPESFILLVCNIDERYFIEVLLPSLVQWLTEHKLVYHKAEILKLLTNQNDPESWINWINTSYSLEGKHTAHVFYFNNATIINLRNWRKIFLKAKYEQEQFRKIRKMHLPLMIFKGINTHENNPHNVIAKNQQNKSISSLIKENTWTLRCSNLIKNEDISNIHSNHDYVKYIQFRMNLLESEHKESLFENLIHWVVPKPKPQKILSSIPIEVIVSEIEKLGTKSILACSSSIQIYLASFKDIPNIIMEIGRLREITFRQVKEGTGHMLDLDNYDPFYDHLFAWDQKEQKIIGAYRLGLAHKIIPAIGKKGLYISSLFKIHDSMNKQLLQSLELGRSFIIREYQKSNLLLLLMWSGIYKSIQRNPNIHYIIGPVSISQEYSKVSRLMIMEYLHEFHFHPLFSKYFKPRKPYRIFKKWPYRNLLVNHYQGNFLKFDSLLTEVQPQGLKIPVLLKQYLKQNAKVLAFNRDPSFQNVLDALIILELKDLNSDLFAWINNRVGEHSK